MKLIACFLLLVATVVLACNDHHYGVNGAVRSISGARYNKLSPVNGSTIVNGTWATPKNQTNVTANGEVYGRCGPGYGACEHRFCCSEHGYCGTGEAYCGARSITQFQKRDSYYFKPALSYETSSKATPSYKSKTVPTSFSKQAAHSYPDTSSIPRPKLGMVPYAATGEVRHCAEPGVIALTFDDGPSAYTSDLLDLLDRYNAKATFFITGNNNGITEIDDCATGYPAIIKRMYESGHQIASHTWSHPDLSGLGEEEFNRQMYRNELALKNILGIIPTYMRPPYISCDWTCTQRLDQMGYHNIYFDVDTVDYWNNDEYLIQNSKDNVANAMASKGWDPSHNSFLIIQHDIHFHSVYSLTEYILKTMAEAGYGTSVTVGSCLGDPRRNWYRDAGPPTLQC